MKRRFVSLDVPRRTPVFYYGELHFVQHSYGDGWVCIVKTAGDQPPPPGTFEYVSASAKIVHLPQLIFAEKKNGTYAPKQ